MCAASCLLSTVQNTFLNKLSWECPRKHVTNMLGAAVLLSYRCVTKYHNSVIEINMNLTYTCWGGGLGAQGGYMLHLGKHMEKIQVSASIKANEAIISFRVPIKWQQYIVPAENRWEASVARYCHRLFWPWFRPCQTLHCCVRSLRKYPFSLFVVIWLDLTNHEILHIK